MSATLSSIPDAPAANAQGIPNCEACGLPVLTYQPRHRACESSPAAPSASEGVLGEPVAWRVRSYSQFKTGKPMAWRYWDGAGRPRVNNPSDCDFEPLYATPAGEQAAPLVASPEPIYTADVQHFSNAQHQALASRIAEAIAAMPETDDEADEQPRLTVSDEQIDAIFGTDPVCPCCGYDNGRGDPAGVYERIARAILATTAAVREPETALVNQAAPQGSVGDAT